MGRKSRALNFVIPNLPTPPSLNSVAKLRSRTQQKPLRRESGTVRTFADFLTAIKEETARITLTDDLTITERIEIQYDVTIDLNGHSLVANIPRERARIFEVSHGELTLTGKGKIFALGEDNVVIRATGALSSGVPDYTVITIDKDVEIYAPEGHAILVTSSTGVAYGVKVELAGKIFAKNGIWLSARVQGLDKTQPRIQIKDSARIIVDDHDGVALQAEGQGEWQLGSTKISGAYGMCLYAGKVELRSPKIIATGSALWLGGENLNLQVLGGVYTGESYGIAGIINDPTRVKLYGGEFWGVEDAVSPDLQILDFSEGGEFHRGVKDFSKKTVSNWGGMPKELIQPKKSENTERQSLVSAITDLRQLNANDFTAGYENLMDCIDRATVILADEMSGVEEIHEIAEELLLRMDALEIADNSMMSDDELDNLFYNKKIPPELLEPDEPGPRKRRKWRIKMRLEAKKQKRLA